MAIPGLAAVGGPVGFIADGFADGEVAFPLLLAGWVIEGLGAVEVVKVILAQAAGPLGFWFAVGVGFLFGLWVIDVGIVDDGGLIAEHPGLVESDVQERWLGLG